MPAPAAALTTFYVFCMLMTPTDEEIRKGITPDKAGYVCTLDDNGAKATAACYPMDGNTKEKQGYTCSAVDSGFPLKLRDTAPQSPAPKPHDDKPPQKGGTVTPIKP